MEVLEYLLKLHRRATAKGYDVYVSNYHGVDGYGIWRNDIPLNKQDGVHRHKGRESYMDIEDDLRIIDEMYQPKYILISKCCMELIGATVYRNKVEPIKVAMIISKTHIRAMDGYDYPIEELYIKE